MATAQGLLQGTQRPAIFRCPKRQCRSYQLIPAVHVTTPWVAVSRGVTGEARHDNGEKRDGAEGGI